MVCEKCGYEIEEGKLYCEKCGNEIQMVPEFDALIEDKIQTHLEDVAEHIDDNTLSEEPELQKTREFDKIISEEAAASVYDNVLSADKESNTKLNIDESKSLSAYRKYKVLAAIAILALIVIVTSLYYYNNTSVKLYERAFQKFELEDFNGSIALLEKAVKKDDSVLNAKLLLCKNYYNLGRFDDSIVLLEELYNDDSTDENIVTELLKNYIAKGDNESVRKVLEESDFADLKEEYKDYMPSSVIFSLTDDLYYEPQYLALKSSEDGDVYYTINGSEASTSSKKFETPILIEPGTTVINAMCVNLNGIESENYTRIYTVDYTVPEAPNIVTEGGAFTTPKLISVNVPEDCSVYYTVNGDEPTAESFIYDGPFPMYIGAHTVKFVSVSDKGVLSDVKEQKYTLDLVNFVDMAEAKDKLKSKLSEKGKKTEDFIYRCEQAYSDGNVNYYIINEYERPNDEIDELMEKWHNEEINNSYVMPENEKNKEIEKLAKVRTGNSYAVDVLDGTMYEIERNSETGELKLSGM